MVIYPVFDPSNSEDTVTFRLGQVGFFTCFTALFIIQLYVLIDGFVLYKKWRRLVTLPKDVTF